MLGKPQVVVVAVELSLVACAPYVAVHCLQFQVDPLKK